MLVTTLTPSARAIGANRIVAGRAITNPFGDPSLSAEDERRFRRSIVERALEALRTPVDGPVVFARDAA